MLHLMAVAAAFNLICTGTMTSRSIAGEKSEPFEHIYRIDLDRQLWCESDCKTQREIFAVQPTSITLQSVDKDTPSVRQMISTTIDRETGEFRSLVTDQIPGRSSTIIILKWAGKCERQPFTGFPKVETKF